MAKVVPKKAVTSEEALLKSVLAILQASNSPLTSSVDHHTFTSSAPPPTLVHINHHAIPSSSNQTLV
eukprot:CAMPEP_0197844976 /NCGR_PEP_ID=MMETSP1438-20131217/1941_1 /TAXON_ID=1461541 /ORGANISM="Pterosperma sp., Strain CCMP1384" /LENGTH=66 /DNA_ID=CAMNT_0043456027 /DNA_START=89 /DNA_END=285 /DNA_ORIENTATION=-